MILRSAVSIVVAAALQAPSFHSATRLVVLHATVRNDRGEIVTGLDRDAFTVFEDGRRQPIALFRNDDVPVSIGLVIDNSGSMRSKRQRVEAAALAFVRASNPQDETFVVNFADTPRIDVAFTADAATVEKGIARVDSIGGTAMRDAVATAERYVADRGRRDRRALLVITDGIDNASEATLEQVRVYAQQHDVAIDAIGLVPDANAGRGRHELEELTRSTGGVVLYPHGLEDIDRAAVELARNIRSQYTLAYTPANQALDGSFRAIKIVARGPGRLTVHTRAGYRATPEIVGHSTGS